jgi:hypothetical protein
MSNFSDLEVDFQTYVAPAYEFRTAHKPGFSVRLPDSSTSRADAQEYVVKPTSKRELVALGKPKLVRPKRRALDLAAGLLLQTPVPRWNEEVQNRGELAHLERNALAVAKHIGLLNAPHEPFAKYRENESEPLESWLYLAQTIQLMFESSRHRIPVSTVGTPVGTMQIHLARRSDGSCFMTLRPRATRDALIYHAAQMIAKGTISQTCEQCGTTFLSGGAGRRKEKKRGDARFCSDECRWKFHNESRRRAR